MPKDYFEEKIMVIHEISKTHPRYESLKIREKIIDGMHKNIVAEAGLIAHGRGEAFDYILGEKTQKFAEKQEKFAVLTLLISKNPVISVNGNIAALCSNRIVEFSKILNAPLEINLFYRTDQRVKAIYNVLQNAGATQIFGNDPDYYETIPELDHNRRIVDSRGIACSDCIFVPLEDGDRTQALRKMGKEVIAVDLNPLSRTSLASTVSITNDIVRTINEMIILTQELLNKPLNELKREKKKYNNRMLLQEALNFMAKRLQELASNQNLLNSF